MINGAKGVKDMKRYAILVAYVEMFRSDYKRYLNSWDKHCNNKNQENKIYKEFDDINKARECFQSIKPSYRSLTCCKGDYKLCEVYQLVMRYVDEDNYKYLHWTYAR